VEDKWTFDRLRETCAKCEREVAPGEDLHSGLVFTGDGFERRDHCAACWEEVRREDFYSHWKTTVPQKEEKPKPKAVNVHVLMDLFRRLVEEKDPRKEGITFLIGMILVQRRALKYREMRVVGGKKVAVLSPPRSRQGYEVVDPEMEAEKMAAMQEELKKILEQD
jgi:hypothetical protein